MDMCTDMHTDMHTHTHVSRFCIIAGVTFGSALNAALTHRPDFS
jgi:hypothetical protein